MSTHDTVLRVEHRPSWQQRLPYPLDHPEVEQRMRDLGHHWMSADRAPVHVTVTAQWKGLSRSYTVSRGVRWV